MAIFFIAFLGSSLAYAGETATPAATDQRSTNAFVSVPRAFVYSGPSEDLYPTDELEHGAAVEVFHQTDSGWAAIRPPQGSFSWLPAAEAFMLPGGRTIEVTSNNSVSWIGTSLGTAKQYRWQVRLNSGEQLIVLGEETVQDSEGIERLWYKVSPPHGEFRWIQSGVLVTEPPKPLPQPPSAPTSDHPSEVVHAKATAESNAVVSSDYTSERMIEGEIIEGEYIEGEIIEGGFFDGEIIEGEYYDGEIIDGSIFTDGTMVHEEVVHVPDASWNDWQLFEFTDEGLRFPMWERKLARRAAAHDPLQHDPFALEMAPKIKGPRMGLITQEDLEPPAAARRRTPWRDPRELAQLRTQGFPQSAGNRGQGTTLSALRDTFDSRSSSLNAPAGQTDYYDHRFAPPTIPNTPASSTPLPISPSFSSPGPQLAPSLDHSVGGGSAVNHNADGSWMNRNWFGLGNQNGTVAGSMVETTSTMLMQLQQRLNEMVTQPMMQWNFGSLKEQAQSVIQTGSSPVERGQARLLMERIQEFERLAMRSGYFLASGSTESGAVSHASFANSSLSTPNTVAASFVSNRSSDPASFDATAAQPSASSSADWSSAFDATGWLVPVHAAVPGQPTHAITDDSGRIVAYVTALPGVNLDRYINAAIGIRGLRGYLPQFQAAHVEAQDVVRLK